jgi:putative oxygen-independent coproporphyrinogen III oxidase
MAQLPLGDPAPKDGLLPNSVLEHQDKSFHAYVHIPFCRVRCGYCDFNTYTATELKGVSQDGFAAHLIEEIRFSAKVLKESGFKPNPLSSVFLGGGTPTQLPASDLAAILAELVATFGVENGIDGLPAAEITTEANPDNVDLEYLTALKAAGFTRVSFGMQSAVASVLKTLDRSHTPERVPLVLEWAKQVGLQTSVDLIYGAPGESIADWQASIDAALSYKTDHISAYSLIVEPGTKLARQIASGALVEPDEDEQATKYELADGAFNSAGMTWYEVSNWSKSEQTQSAHNLSYWQSKNWWGYGPGAHSHIGGVRWWNQKHPASYVAPLARGLSPALGRETLDSKTQLEEQVLLMIRTRQGLPVQVLKDLNVFDPKLIAGLIADQLVDPASAMRGTIQLTQNGRLLADSVIRTLIA